MPEPASTRRFYRFGPFELDAVSGELRRDGALVRLQDKPLQVLLLLLEQPGELTPRAQLRRRLWPADTFVDFDTGLNTAVSKLREALGDSAETPTYIQTLPRRGYRFVGPLAASADDALRADATSALPPRTAYPRWRSVGGLSTAVVLLATLAGSPGGKGQPPTAFEARSIAVLPLTEAKGSRVEGYLVDGMTDGVITELGYLTSLTVFPRSAVTRALQANGMGSDVARVIGADVLVRGEVAHENGHVRMTAELVEPKAGRRLWSASYQRPDDDLINLQRDLAVAVTQQLGLTTTGQQTRPERARTIPAAAYLAYLKGRFYADQTTEEGSWRAIASFQEAITLASDYAPAYAALARAYRLLNHVRPPAEIDARTWAAVNKALELDPDLAEAHSVLAEMEMERLQWVRAEAAHRRAIALNPSDAMSHVYYAAFLNQAERHEEALVAIRRAEALDPLSPFIAANVILRLSSLGRFEDALAQGHKALAIDSNLWLTHQWMGGAYWRLGRKQDAIAAWERALALQGGFEVWAVQRLAEGYWSTGRRQAARMMIARLEKHAETTYVEPVVLARAYASVGKTEAALLVLERAYREGDVEPQRMRGLAVFLGKQPRYQSLEQFSLVRSTRSWYLSRRRCDGRVFVRSPDASAG
jgi:DNA-binding winged helix-turn-helix (wHTH) protein/TolB-like protein/Flp pilus assembly protein TadD